MKRFKIQVYLASLLLLISLLNKLSAQEYRPFPTKNCIWTEFFHPGGGVYKTNYHNYALKDNDTIINGKQYHKLYHSFDTIFTEDKVCGGLREENKRVYYYSIDSLISLNTPLPIGTEIILYDFNLQVGDTIWDDTYRLRRINGLVLAKTDSILLNTEYRKAYTFSYIWSQQYLFNADRWVEGIGCMRGLLSDIGDIPTSDYSCWLICFIQEGEVLYHDNNFSTCFNNNTNRVELLNGKSKIKISPNPIGSSARVELDNSSYKKLVVTDQYGRTMRKYNLEGTRSLNIDREDLARGIYLLTIYDKAGSTQTLKVIFDDLK